MWKRLPLYNRPRDPVIGYPVLIETSLDQGTLNDLPNVSDLHNRRNPEVDRSRRKSGDMLKGLPQLPFRSLEEPRQPRPVSEVPTVSSIYSQDPLGSHPHQNSSYSPYTGYTEISPPGSPDINVRRGSQDHYHRSPSISPIEETIEAPEAMQTRSAKFISSIPVLRRERKRSQSGAGATGKGLGIENPDRESTLTRWGDFSGEPTTDTKGKTPTVWPGNYVEISSTGRGNNGESDGRDTSSRGLGPSLGARGDWKGPVGQASRTGQTDNKPLSAPEPIVIPQASMERPSFDSGLADTYAKIDRYSRRNRETFGASAGSRNPDYDEDGVKPTVPLKAGRNSPPRNLTSPTTPTGPGFPSTQTNSDSRSSTLFSSRNKPLPKPLPTPVDLDGTGGIEENFRNAMKNIQISEPTVSRFSATTYATGTTFDTPPASPPKEVTSGKFSPPSPLMNRRRPVPGSQDKRITRKPPPSQGGSGPSSPVRASIIPSRRHSKSLPQSPPEAQSVDLITTLQAQLDDLHTRRGNLQKILRELTQLLPPNPSTYDVSARGDMKKRVDAHKMELAEILKEEHEIGLRLHRAWRRRDRQNSLGEPTGLWVRRVTG